MQKIALSKIIREEILRAIVFASVLFTLLFAGFATIVYAADGGKFGEILNQILASGNWQSPGDGTVRNCNALWWTPASGYVRVPPAGFSCPGANTCIYGIQTNGTPMCR